MASNSPKGIANRVTCMQPACGPHSGDVILLKTPFSFDVSGLEVFWPLIVGARLAKA